MPASPALDASDRLRHVAAVLRSLSLLEAANRVGVDLSDPGSQPEAHVHSCTPEQLAAVQTRYAIADTNIDADGILRWLEADLNGVTFTFYRR